MLRMSTILFKINHMHDTRRLISSLALVRLKHYISTDKKYSHHLIIYLSTHGKARTGLLQ